MYLNKKKMLAHLIEFKSNYIECVCFETRLIYQYYIVIFEQTNFHKNSNNFKVNHHEHLIIFAVLWVKTEWQLLLILKTKLKILFQN